MPEGSVPRGWAQFVKGGRLVQALVEARVAPRRDGVEEEAVGSEQPEERDHREAPEPGLVPPEPPPCDGPLARARAGSATSTSASESGPLPASGDPHPGVEQRVDEVEADVSDQDHYRDDHRYRLDDWQVEA